MNEKETVYLVAFFKFAKEGPLYGFKRIDLQRIFKTEKEARSLMSFCDEAGWYEGALIEEREIGPSNFFRGKKVWLLQKENGTMEEIPEPFWYNNVFNIIG